ncbi:hypothetical protein KBB96_13455 [Luteolibacter ambystomatis]|uniref:Uncharacterized protein n=1 Tax=Luteolibacter ambystomatis TaxID=2824561 RepID=A0A975IZM8_9BACT|nr:hypothetical protein [Luteolibacter ambystomatis]QUE49875.1 hypothetical protein KBB96_13455 [Luteolibacter ambystomatis]
MNKKFVVWLAVPFVVCTALLVGPSIAREGAQAGMEELLSGISSAPDARVRIENEGVRYIPGPERSVVQIPCYHFIDGDGRRLELTGAVHIADKEYYEGLNRHFEGFDAVLFELVADPDKVAELRRMEPGRAGATLKESQMSKLYRVLAHDLLGLSLQIETIDYRRSNFVHADMGEKELEALLKARGRTLDDLLEGKLKGSGINLEQIVAMLPMLKTLIPKDDPKALQRMMAPMLAKLESPEGGSEDKLFNEIVVMARNTRAIEVLDQQLAAGKRNLALFYGSDHFSDLRKRLLAKGWKEEKPAEWRDAWVIPAKVEAVPVPTKVETSPGK